jgi:dephospho-CoA kinase
LHPLIRREVERRLEMLEAPYVIIVAPLLIESGFTDLVDRVLVVDSSEEDQIRRVQQRSGLAESEIGRILAVQLGRSARLSQADDVIVNDADVAHLAREVQRLDHAYRHAAASTAR